jgi:hypothetical protein
MRVAWLTLTGLSDFTDIPSGMALPLDAARLDAAFQRLGDLVAFTRDVDLLLVGSAAAIATGVLPRGRTTTDCDVMFYEPADAAIAVQDAADRVALELGLPPGWLNTDVQIRLDALPDGWERRKVLIALHGRIRVWGASRPDLIAMKVLAGRPKDLEDLRAMRVRTDDIAFVQGYLDSLPAKGTHREEIESARLILQSLAIHGHE